MLLTVLGILISTACVYASVRRLGFVAEATALDPGELARALRRRAGEASAAEVARRLRIELGNDPRCEWERDLLAATFAPSSSRVALVNEQVAELDYRAQRWARVPRVCASISSSMGFLLAALAMRAGLASADIEIDEAIRTAINVVTVGLAGATFCAASHFRAGAMTKGRLAAADGLVERLEGLAEDVERAGGESAHARAAGAKDAAGGRG